jgi:hypothetical protein
MDWGPDLRYIIDAAAIVCVGRIAMEAYGDWRIALACQVLTGAYALWCFYDGAGRP